MKEEKEDKMHEKEDEKEEKDCKADDKDAGDGVNLDPAIMQAAAMIKLSKQRLQSADIITSSLCFSCMLGSHGWMKKNENFSLR